MKWNYKDLGRVNGNNVHAVQCAGRSGASDVLAAIPYERVKYKSLQHTWRCSTGEDLKISISKTEDNAKNLILHKLPDNPYFPSKQGKVFVLNSDSQSYSFTLNSTTPEDSGLYYYYVNEKEDSWESYFNILVRDCEAGKFGPECSKSCQECQNGGQCHSYTGECLCPPGFIGSACQHACPKGWFGTKCQFECGATTSDQLGPEKGSCKGLTLCLPSPMGCSCFPGYKGPMCDEDCISGTFGAGCLEKCSDKCNSNLCDPYTGSCYNSDNVLSTKAPTGVNVNDELLLSWRDEDPDGQHLYFVTLEVKNSCNNDQTRKTELHLVQLGNQMQLPRESLQNSKFEVCVTTSDLTRGHSSPTCTSHVTPKEPNVTFLQHHLVEVIILDVNYYVKPRSREIASTFMLEISSWNSVYRHTLHVTGHQYITQSQ
ncbi:laminin subunit gamma-3-like [Macrobrachium nipponense]|uniref:laminin subunit gamma-3-like n=1 Tax=Macrobrachium nipponense TaxID=159736 RepID=UPI0030C7F8C3